MKKKIIALLLCALMVFVTVAFAACSKTPAGTDEETTAAPGGEETTAAAPVVDDLAYVQDKGTMMIGYTDFAPMNYMDKDGELIGFDTDLAKAVCAKLGVTPVFQEIKWETKVINLDAKEIDCIWNGMTIRDELKAEIDFSEAYMANKQVVVIRAADADKYTDLASLAGAAVAVEAGSAGEDAAKADEGLSKNVIAVSAQTDALKEVKAGASDVAVLDATMGYSMVGEGTDFSDLLVLDAFDDSANEEYGIGFRKGSTLTDAVNAALEALAADGTLAQIAKTYGLETRILIGE